MSKKISSSDLPPGQNDADRTALQIFLSKESQHFKPGTYILHDGRRGLIKRVTSCRCELAEKTLRILWDDGTLGSLQPIALNR